MSGRSVDGRPFRIPTVVDGHTREALSCTSRADFRAFQVTAALDALVRLRGRPKRLRVDNGPEFAGRMLDQWAYLNGVAFDFSRPGKPTDNGNNRVVQRPPPSGMPERFVVAVAGRCPRAHRGLELPRRRRSTSHGPGRLEAPILRRPGRRSPGACIGRGPQTGSTPKPTMLSLRTWATEWGQATIRRRRTVRVRERSGRARTASACRPASAADITPGVARWPSHALGGFSNVRQNLSTVATVRNQPPETEKFDGLAEVTRSRVREGLHRKVQRRGQLRQGRSRMIRRRPGINGIDHRERSVLEAALRRIF